jgi:hypothetical protein
MSIRNIVLKVKLLAKGMQEDKFYLFNKIKQKIKQEQVYFYVYKRVRSGLTRDDVSIRKITLDEVFDFYEKEGGLTEINRGFYLKVVPSGERVPWGLFNSKMELASIMFIVNPTPEYLPDVNSGLKEKILVLLDARTATIHKGNGYYPILLKAIAEQYPDVSVLGLANDWNIASQKGLIKAGYVQFAIRFGTKKFKWISVQ